MAELQIKGRDGQAVGTRTVGAAIAEARVSLTSVHRSVVAENANSRQGTQKTKTRSEVRGGGRKPYKQKKTGNARQGSIRSPHYAHGGMALALEPRDYSKKQNRKERRAAILAALSAQIEAGNVHVVDEIRFALPRTKDAVALLDSLGLAGARRILVILPEHDEATYRSFRNLPNVEVRTAPASVKPGEAVTSEVPSGKKRTARPAGEGPKTQGFSTRDVLIAHHIVVADPAFDRIEEVWAQ